MNNNGSNKENSNLIPLHLNSTHPDLIKSQPLPGSSENFPLLSKDTLTTNTPVEKPVMDAPLATLENFDELEPTASSSKLGVDDGSFEKSATLEDDSDDIDGNLRFQPGNPLLPYGNALPPSVGSMETIPDVNIYQHKKTLAQGMMDIALFSANANQLRYVLENPDNSYYYPGLIMISISIVFQVLVGIGLILNTRYNVKDCKEICFANKINNLTIVGIFLVTVINVFISAFGVTTNSTSDVANDVPPETS